MYVLMLIKQFGLAGSLDHISKGAGTAMLCSNFGQPKAECDPTSGYTHPFDTSRQVRITNFYAVRISKTPKAVKSKKSEFG
jgi:hypothetical protein